MSDEPRYYRVESPTQTPTHARLQSETGELWGMPARWSEIPKVKAYVGPLPEGRAGIEFTTAVSPDDGCPPERAYWSGPRTGVEVSQQRIEIDGSEVVAWCAKINVKIVKNTQGS